MFEETPYLQPQPGTAGSYPAWLTTPEVHTTSPGRGVKREMLQSYRSRTAQCVCVCVCCTFGERSFRIIVTRVRGGDPPMGESGMKEDQ